MQLLISNEQDEAAVDGGLCSLIEAALREVLALEMDVRRQKSETGTEGIGFANPTQNPTTDDRRPTTDMMEVSLSLIDDVRMESLNRQYRGIAGTTDVLSFSMLEDEGRDDGEVGIEDGNGEAGADKNPMTDDRRPATGMELLLGDIVISVPRAISQSAVYGNSFQAEMVFLAVHGMLHLLGYDDETEPGAARMMERARQVMDRLGLEAGRDA